MNQEELRKKKQAKHIYEFTKRCFDLLSSIIVIILILPIYLCISILVKFDSKGTIFIKHERLGRDGKLIKVYKF